MTTNKRTGIAKVTIAAVAFLGTSALTSLPAHADRFGVSIGVGDGIEFSYDSGGYCDRWGCPSEFWDYPLYYCPVFYDGTWYRGPVYYRRRYDELWFWVHGDWHRDEWDGPRPYFACQDRFGPPLDFDYYETHGFNWSDDWRRRWWDENRDFYPGWDFDWWRGHHRDWDRDHDFGDWRGRHHDHDHGGDDWRHYNWNVGHGSGLGRDEGHDHGIDRDQVGGAGRGHDWSAGRHEDIHGNDGGHGGDGGPGDRGDHSHGDHGGGDDRHGHQF